MTATSPVKPRGSTASVSFKDARGAIGSQLGTLEASCGKATAAQAEKLKLEAERTLDRLKEEGGAAAVDNGQALRDMVVTLAEKLPEGWTDVCAAQVVFLVATRLKEEAPPLLYIRDNIGTWLDNHVDQPADFNFCLQIHPPAGIAVEKVLDAGAQKQVFVAKWPEVTPYKVAFKHFHDSDGSGSGDSFSHPLRGHHPNIIETFPLQNVENADDVYLVERLLSTTLRYGWDFGGLGEIVNLIRDIAHALSFVHSYKRIHGDVKLENIGFEEVYILLDFGLCRSEPADACQWTPTGNVRGLAPEQLHGQANTSKSDIWALASVAYGAITGRPPFFKPQEKQSGFGETERARTLARLAKRADDPKWKADLDRRLADAVPEIKLRQLILEMLDADPARRPTALEVFQRCNDQLPQFLRPVEAILHAAPEEELATLRYLQKADGIKYGSRAQRTCLKDAARHIEVEQLEEIEQMHLEGLEEDLKLR